MSKRYRYSTIQPERVLLGRLAVRFVEAGRVAARDLRDSLPTLAFALNRLMDPHVMAFLAGLILVGVAAKIVSLFFHATWFPHMSPALDAAATALVAIVTVSSLWAHVILSKKADRYRDAIKALCRAVQRDESIRSEARIAAVLRPFAKIVQGETSARIHVGLLEKVGLRFEPISELPGPNSEFGVAIGASAIKALERGLLVYVPLVRSRYGVCYEPDNSSVELLVDVCEPTTDDRAIASLMCAPCAGRILYVTADRPNSLDDRFFAELLSLEAALLVGILQGSNANLERVEAIQ